MSTAYQINSTRPSSQSGRNSFSHHISFGPRRSTSVHSLHQSFQLPSLKSTPTLQRLGAKLFQRKPSSSISSISTDPITTTTTTTTTTTNTSSLSPQNSDGQLTLDPTHSKLPQLISSQFKNHHSNLTSPSFISIANRSQSLSSLSQTPHSKKSSHPQPFIMDDDSDYFQNSPQSVTPNLKYYSNHLIQTPNTPLEKPEFQTEYARQLFGGNTNLQKYSNQPDQDEELATLEPNPIYPKPPFPTRISHNSTASLSRLNIHLSTSSTLNSQDTSSEQSHSSHPSSHQRQTLRLASNSSTTLSPFVYPTLSSHQTPALNSNLKNRSIRSTSTFRSSVRRKVDGLKVGMKLLKPSRIPVDQANCLVSADDPSESFGHEAPDSLDFFNSNNPSRDSIQRSSLQSNHNLNQVPSNLNKPTCRSTAVRSSIHRHPTEPHDSSSSPTPIQNYSNDKRHHSNFINQVSKVSCENDAFTPVPIKSKPRSNNTHSQQLAAASQRLRPGRIPLQSLDLDSHSRDGDRNDELNSSSTFKSHHTPASGPTLQRSSSSSALEYIQSSLISKNHLVKTQTISNNETTLQPGHQVPIPTPLTSSNRRRSPILHESSNDLRRQIAREVNGNPVSVSKRTYSDSRLTPSITPSSNQTHSNQHVNLNLSKNLIQKSSSSVDPIGRSLSSIHQTNISSYPSHSKQYPQFHSSDQESLQQPNHHQHHHHHHPNLPTNQSKSHGQPQVPFTPVGTNSQRGSKYQTPNLNHRWSSSALSSTIQQPQRVRRPTYSSSHSPIENDQIEMEDQPLVPSRNSQLISNQRQFYVHEDQGSNQNSHLRVPSQDEPDFQIRKQSLEANRMDKNLIVVNHMEYVRQCVIGRGGSSKVFRASLNDGSPKLVAIKVVGLKQSDNQTYLTFCNEIELLKRLRGNDRIINLIDSAMDDVRRKVWLVMELGETDLNQLLNRQMGKPISFRFIKHIWEQMLQAVQAVHDQDIIHTDLKPANFVLVQGSVKIIDFGIAKAIPADTTNISRETQIGTANYMSPEALMMQQYGDGQRVKMGRATDVWALGCILYQMIYGHTPFSKLETSFKVHTIRDPQHVIDYPESVTPVEVSSEGKKIMLHDQKVFVEQEAISTMRGCLSYDKNKRLEIIDLLKHPFLMGPSLGISTPASNNNPKGQITIPTSMVDDIVHKAWDWYTRKTINGNQVSENQKNKFILSIKDSIQCSQ